MWDVVRYREIAGALGQRAVIVPAAVHRSGARARLRVGPDGLAYLAVAEPAAAAGRTPTVSLLRFDIEGRPPAGQPSRLWRSGLQGGVALDWHPSTGALWVGSADVVAGVLVAGDETDPRLATLLVALADGTLQRRLVVQGAQSRVVRRTVVAIGPAERATALVRRQDGAVSVAVCVGRSGPDPSIGRCQVATPRARAGLAAPGHARSAGLTR